MNEPAYRVEPTRTLARNYRSLHYRHLLKHICRSQANCASQACKSVDLGGISSQSSSCQGTNGRRVCEI